MFPLYSQLIRNAKEKEKDITAQQKKSLVSKIEKLDQNGSNVLFALISKYQSDNETNCNIIPYNGIYTTTDTNTLNIQFDLEHMPIKLKHVINDFMDLHEKKEN